MVFCPVYETTLFPAAATPKTTWLPGCTERDQVDHNIRRLLKHEGHVDD